MTTTLHVLAVGLHRPIHIADCAYILGRQCELTEIVHFYDLNWFRIRGKCDIAVLGDRLLQRELREAAQLIRRQWPHAAILLVCAETAVIEDLLYESHLPSESTHGMLVAGICSFVEGKQTKSWKY